MAGVKEIEATVREADGQPLPAPLRARQQGGLCRHAGSLRDRQPAREDGALVFDLRGGDRGRSRPEHRDAGGDVGKGHGFLRRAAFGDGERKSGDRRVSRSGHVDDLMRVRRHMDRRAVRPDQRHAVFGAGHEKDGAGRSGEGRRRCLDLPVIVHGKVRGRFQLTAIGLDEAGAAIVREVATLRIDDHAYAGLGRQLRRGFDHPIGDEPLAVVGDHDEAALGHLRLQRGDDLLLTSRRDRSRDLSVEAQELIVAGQEPGLDRCRPVCGRDQVKRDPGVPQKLCQPLAFGIGGHAGDEMCRSAHGDDVESHIGGAAAGVDGGLLPDDRHRSFWRNSVDAPEDRDVEHRIADDQNGNAGRNPRAQPRGERGRGHRRTVVRRRSRWDASLMMPFGFHSPALTGLCPADRPRIRIHASLGLFGKHTI